jgi:hypothetical protein
MVYPATTQNGPLKFPNPVEALFADLLPFA